MGQSTLGRPTTGTRYVLELAEKEPSFVLYRGWIYLPDATLRSEVRVELSAGPDDRAGAERVP